MAFSAGYGLQSKYLGNPFGKIISRVRGKPDSISNSKNQTNNHSTNQQHGNTHNGQHDKTTKHFNSSSELDDYYNDLKGESQKKVNRADRQNDLDYEKTKIIDDEIKDLKQQRQSTHADRDRNNIPFTKTQLKKILKII